MKKAIFSIILIFSVILGAIPYKGGVNMGEGTYEFNDSAYAKENGLILISGVDLGEVGGKNADIKTLKDAYMKERLEQLEADGYEIIDDDLLENGTGVKVLIGATDDIAAIVMIHQDVVHEEIIWIIIGAIHDKEIADAIREDSIDDTNEEDIQDFMYTYYTKFTKFIEFDKNKLTK
jgi:metal-dependent hydrolase (beta-lactamase superfamily II)